MDLDQRRARREERKREQARRRARGLAAVAVLVAIGAIVAVVIASGGRSSKPGSSSTATSGTRSSATHGGASAAATPASGAAQADKIVTPAQASHRVPGGVSVPILMYHVINPPPAGAKFPGLYVSKVEFAEQMQGQQSLAWADNAIKLAVEMTVAAVERVNLQGSAEAQAEQIRTVMATVFPEAVTLVREARAGLQ